MRGSLLLLMLMTLSLSLAAQPRIHGKLSPWLRQLASKEKRAESRTNREATKEKEQAVCAFVKLTKGDTEVFNDYNAISLAQEGNIHIANIPLSQLTQMAADHRINRIESSPLGTALLDSMSTHLNALPVYAGQQLPQAFTGKDVVVGIMDIGFDLTHPNYYTRDMKDYRVKRFWDMLSKDTVGSHMPVGRDYASQEQLLTLGHSADGNDFTHGTYTSGVAVGSGYNSVYRGMAPESDICMVANAVSNNIRYIDPTQLYKFTDALNALGFKYIFDYAESVGKPCVISLSEGGHENFWGDSQLYYEMLEQLVGPGRILVASAGNEGYKKTWMRKERGVESEGTFAFSSDNMIFTLKSKEDFQFRFVFYLEEGNDTVTISTKEILQCQDSIYRCEAPRIDSLVVGAYPSCYDRQDVCYEVVLYNKATIGYLYPLSIELIGREADIELWPYSMFLCDNETNPRLNGAETSHNIHAPAAASCVICVGATTYRDSIVSAQGETMIFIDGERGRKANMSSTGPTMDGRIKPDVMAPGINVISSYSSYYIANHPEADDARWNVAYYEYNGRRYAWNCNSGTSSSSPAVAGVIALWLQAKPDLTPEEVKQLIARTSRHNDPSLDYPNTLYGYGEIDAYRGLLDLLGVDHIEGVSPNATPVQFSMNEQGLLRLQFPEMLKQKMQLKLYRLDGSLILSSPIAAGDSTYTVDMPLLKRSDIYVIQLDGYKPYAGSMLVRKGK